MLIYWINLIVLLLWVVLFKVSGIKNNRIILSAFFLELYFILAFRDPSVGADTESYIHLFELTKEYSFFNFSFSRHEPGYILLNKILGSFVDNHQIFIAIMGFIVLFLFFRVIYNESKIQWLSVFLFITLGFYTYTFSLFRLIIAMSLVFTSYQFIIRNEAKKFFITIIIASLFHISALVFLPVYFLRRININFKMIIFYSLSATFIVLFSGRINKFILESGSSIEYNIKSGGGFSYLFLLLGILLISLYFKRSLLSEEPNANVLFHILFMGILFQLLALDFGLINRVARYFFLFLIILIPNIISLIREKKLRIFAVYALCSLAPIFYYIMLNTDGDQIVPYKFFF